MTQPHIWLRAETKPLEKRRALSPDNAGKLLRHGFDVTVEISPQSIFKHQDYEAAGCALAQENSWHHQAPPKAYILGLKELEQSHQPLKHRHIYFAHVFKEQAGWQDHLCRFKQGGGTLYDIEYLVNGDGRRIAAFGYWAGFTGAALAVQAWLAQLDGVVLSDIEPYRDKHAMVKTLTASLATGDRRPSMIVLGAKGRAGQGAVAAARQLGVEVTQWDMKETRNGGPFEDILGYDIFVNTVFVQQKIAPFLTNNLLAKEIRNLSIICDVSCDPSSECNPLPIYQNCTTFGMPCTRLIDDAIRPLDLIAIDHLPSLLPAESSEDFSSQLLPYLLDIKSDQEEVWSRANTKFMTHIEGL